MHFFMHVVYYNIPKCNPEAVENATFPAEKKTKQIKTREGSSIVKFQLTSR